MATVVGTGNTGNVWLDSIVGDSRWSSSPPTGAATVIDVYIAGGGEFIEHWDGGVRHYDRVYAAGPGAQERAAMTAAMASLEAVCNVDFRMVSSQWNADLVWASVDSFDAEGFLGWADLPGGAYGDRFGAMQDSIVPRSLIAINHDAYHPNAGPDVLAKGGYDFTTFIHELGHAMGLGHPHDRTGGSTVMPGVGAEFGDLGAHAMNQGVFTTMSYNAGWSTGPQGPSPSAVYGYQAGPMALDVAALQFMYGANASHRTGDDAYRLPGSNGAGTAYSCLWDAGGTDRIWGTGRDDVIDLRAATLERAPGGGGYVSHAGGVHGGFTIAHGVGIEDATGGGGADALQGNDAANSLSGSAGDDRLSGAKGHDRLWGDGGDDALRGGWGDDRLTGGAGRDWLKGDGGRDAFVLRAPSDSPGAGRDMIVDFARGEDDLHLAALDARRDVTGDQAFALNANRTFSMGEVNQRRSGGDLVVELNLDRDADAEMSLLVLGVRSLGAADFVL